MYCTSSIANYWVRPCTYTSTHRRAQTGTRATTNWIWHACGISRYLRGWQKSRKRCTVATTTCTTQQPHWKFRPFPAKSALIHPSIFRSFPEVMRMASCLYAPIQEVISFGAIGRVTVLHGVVVCCPGSATHRCYQ